MFLRDIVRKGSEMFDVSEEDILSDRRSRSTAKARFAIEKAMSLRGNSTTKIGQIMDRNHASVIYGLGKADMWCATDPIYKEQVEYLASFSGYDLKH